MNRRMWALVFLAVLFVAAFLIACGSGSSGKQASTVSVTLSDPATCAAPNGPFSNVYVTIVDVQVNASASAGDNDSGWTSVIPDTKGTPQQVDLLGIANNQCFLKTLGSTTLLQPGSYQQIRVILGDDSKLPSQNLCGIYANCVMLTSDTKIPKTPYPLLLSSETKTGIKIPAGQIAGGQFVIAAGESKDLNIDFNTCASIVTQGNGGFRLKPVLHAGEVKLTANNVTGKVVDNATGLPIPNATIVVALEQNVGGTEILKQQTLADASGNFAFCPVDDLPSGTYDVVVSAISTSNNVTTAYAPTITTGVVPGMALGNVKMFAAGAPATITGLVTTQKPGPAGTGADVALSLWQPVTLGGSSVNVIVPLAAQSAVSVPIATEQNAACPTNTFCKDYSMMVAAGNAAVGSFSASGTNYLGGSGTVNYQVNALASVPNSGGVLDCSPSTLTTPPVTVTAGANPVKAADINFTGCQ